MPRDDNENDFRQRDRSDQQTTRALKKEAQRVRGTMMRRGGQWPRGFSGKENGGEGVFKSLFEFDKKLLNGDRWWKIKKWAIVCKETSRNYRNSLEKLTLPRISSPELLHKTAPAGLHGKLSYLKLTPNALQYNGFPSFSAVIPQIMDVMGDFEATEDPLRKCSRCSKDFYIMDAPRNCSSLSIRKRFWSTIRWNRISKFDPIKCDQYGAMAPQKCVYHHRKKFDQNEAFFAHDAHIQAPSRFTDWIVSWCTLQMDLVARVSLVNMKWRYRNIRSSKQEIID
ncbi:hypothetical protein B9Z55_022895 [Caenorhabditis nigoni]|uniref:Uncharacterized protein n=1 Tax=Caenorhabditis nigoni TaxID=1611254 RepID=A0A2G5SMG5_9PELO|nr:hypothetical protein B9Z55_022895 [Caenorhabditis nigoni]